MSWENNNVQGVRKNFYLFYFESFSWNFLVIFYLKISSAFIFARVYQMSCIRIPYLNVIAYIRCPAKNLLNGIISYFLIEFWNFSSTSSHPKNGLAHIFTPRYWKINKFWKVCFMTIFFAGWIFHVFLYDYTTYKVSPPPPYPQFWKSWKWNRIGTYYFFLKAAYWILFIWCLSINIRIQGVPKSKFRLL